MRRNHRVMLQHAAGMLAWVLLMVVPAGAAEAARYTSSSRPHWEVGTVDPALSGACRLGRFNQHVDHRRHIAYRGQVGTGVTGIARRGWNLRDPDGRAAADATYHFADDGLSTCRVYVVRDISGP